jgi:hypothetical protein
LIPILYESPHLAKNRDYTHHPPGSLPEMPRQINECKRLFTTDSIVVVEVTPIKRIVFLILLVSATCCFLEAQTSPPAVVFHGSCATGLPQFEEWYRHTRLPQESYVAAGKRKQQLLDNYPKLKLKMSLEDVENLLGKPDFATATPAPHLATAPEWADKRCSNELAYIVKKKHENMADMEDVAIYLSFSREGKLYWAAPQNLPTLKQLGSPTEGK